MSEDDYTLMFIRGSIADMPADDQARVTLIADQLRTLITGGGQHAALALALVGAEVQAGRVSL